MPQNIFCIILLSLLFQFHFLGQGWGQCSWSPGETWSWGREAPHKNYSHRQMKPLTQGGQSWREWRNQYLNLSPFLPSIILLLLSIGQTQKEARGQGQPGDAVSRAWRPQDSEEGSEGQRRDLCGVQMEACQHTSPRCIPSFYQSSLRDVALSFTMVLQPIYVSQFSMF